MIVHSVTVPPSGVAELTGAINIEVEALNTWLPTNRITINRTKTKYNIFIQEGNEYTSY